MKTINKILITFCVFALTLCLFVVPAFADLPTSSLDTEYSLRLSGTNTDPIDHYLSVGAYQVTRQYNSDWGAFGVMVCALDSSGNPITNLRVRIAYDIETLYTQPSWTLYAYGVYGYTWAWDEIPQAGQTIQLTIENLPYDSFVIAFAFSDEYSDYFADTMAFASQINYSLSARLSAPDYYQDGFDDGYDAGFDAGTASGFNVGYNQGLMATDDIANSVFTVVSAPFEAITNFLDFEILGINLKQIFAFTLAVVIVVFIVKRTKD